MSREPPRRRAPPDSPGTTPWVARRLGWGRESSAWGQGSARRAPEVAPTPPVPPLESGLWSRPLGARPRGPCRKPPGLTPVWASSVLQQAEAPVLAPGPQPRPEQPGHLALGRPAGEPGLLGGLLGGAQPGARSPRQGLGPQCEGEREKDARPTHPRAWRSDRGARGRLSEAIGQTARSPGGHLEALEDPLCAGAGGGGWPRAAFQARVAVITLWRRRFGRPTHK